MRRMTLIALGLVSVVAAAPAFAQDEQDAPASDKRFYVGGFLGDRLGGDQTFSGSNIAGQPRVIDTPTKDHITGGLMIGVVAAQGDWGRMRVEGEVSASQNAIKRLVLNDVRRDLLEGRKSITSEMVNVMYDTPKLANLVRLSVGGGVGNASIDYDVRYNVSATGPAINIPTSVSGHLAWQAIGGASISLNRRVDLTTDVRYLRVSEHQVERFNATAGTLDSVLATRYHGVAATAGFRFYL
jgi:opacity protein-like surface antigen